jgi:soluble lytic murein transglycosylase-like protein
VDRSVRGRRAPLFFLLALLAGGARADGLYHFVDADGTPHFSNIPNDRRYVRIAEKKRSAPKVKSYDLMISEAADTHGVPPALVKAVVATESSFNPRAVSAKGAQGLMQLMPATARSLGVEEPLRVEQNLDGGVRYLRSLIDRYGDWSRALAAYNAGPTAVDRYGGIPPYSETREYVDRVLTYYRRYHGDFPR